MGHVYASCLVIRCQHRECYTVSACAWVDRPDGDTEELGRVEMTFGPFDTLDVIADGVHEQLRQALATAMVYPSI